MDLKLQKVKLNNRMDFIKNAVMSASALGVDALIIESGMIRGCDEGKVVFIAQTNDIDVPFSGLGINRIDVFKQRLQLFETMADVNFEAHIHPETKEVILLNIKSPSVSVDYRCAHCIEPNPIIKSPKGFKDPIKFEFQMSEEDIEILIKGQAAMGGDIITLSGNAQGVQFKVLDKSNDEFVHTVTPSFTNKESNKKNDGEFSFPFATKTLLNMLKNATDSTFGLNEKGVLKGTAKNLSTYIVRKL